MFRTLYASRINKEYPRPQKNYPCNPCNPCSKTLRTTESEGESTSRDLIRVLQKQFVLPIMPNKMKYTYLCAEETGNPQNEHAT